MQLIGNPKSSCAFIYFQHFTHLEEHFLVITSVQENVRPRGTLNNVKYMRVCRDYEKLSVQGRCPGKMGIYEEC